LEKKKKGTPSERIVAALKEAKGLSIDDLLVRTSLDQMTLQNELKSEDFIQYYKNEYTMNALVEVIEEELYNRLRDYHTMFPMKQCINQKELVQTLEKTYPKELRDYVIEQAVAKKIIKRQEQFYALDEFTPHIPK